MSSNDVALEADRLRGLFEHSREPRLGAEEELMVLDSDTLDLLPCAEALLGSSGLDTGAVKLELPASHLEIATPVAGNLRDLTRELSDGRARLVRALSGRVRLAGAGVHPFAAGEGRLNEGGRYTQMLEDYGAVARRQLVCGLHIHVGLSGAERVLGVYNAMRGWLPLLAALGANAPVYEGRDSGFASVRPLISGMLPRQGVPPSYDSWEQLAADLAWGTRAGRLQCGRGWWWELRLHPVLGTLEVRVPDAQSSVQDAAAIVTSAAALVLWLAERYDGGDLPPPAASWRIAENRFSAARHGVHGTMIDLESGATGSTSDQLHCMLGEIEAAAASIGGLDGIAHARRLADASGADRQRELFAERGARGLVETLSVTFERPLDLGDGGPPSVP
jgi:carboxylate-amine ligase